VPQYQADCAVDSIQFFRFFSKQYTKFLVKTGQITNQKKNKNKKKHGRTCPDAIHSDASMGPAHDMVMLPGSAPSPKYLAASDCGRFTPHTQSPHALAPIVLVSIVITATHLTYLTATQASTTTMTVQQNNLVAITEGRAGARWSTAESVSRRNPFSLQGSDIRHTFDTLYNLHI
jgi:hypothetical protein